MVNMRANQSIRLLGHPAMSTKMGTDLIRLFNREGALICSIRVAKSSEFNRQQKRTRRKKWQSEWLATLV